jgi:hypothetical protein
MARDEAHWERWRRFQDTGKWDKYVPKSSSNSAAQFQNQGPTPDKETKVEEPTLFDETNHPDLLSEEDRAEIMKHSWRDHFVVTSGAEAIRKDAAARKSLGI